MKRNTFTLFAFLTLFVASLTDAFGQATVPHATQAAALRLLEQVRTSHPALAKALTAAPLTARYTASPNTVLQTANTISKPRREVKYTWVNNAWREDSTMRYTYDQAANVTEEVVVVAGQEKSRTLTVYNATGTAPEMITYQNKQGAAWQDDEREVFVYNQAGTFIEHHLEQKQGANWVLVEGRKREFVVNGSNVGMIKEQAYTNGAWANASQYTLTYENNVITSITEQVWEEGAWVNNMRFTNLNWRDLAGLYSTMMFNPYFEASGATAFVNSAMMQTWEEDEQKFVDALRVSNIIEANGQTISLIEADFMGTWMMFMRITFTPDERGNMATSKLEGPLTGTIENRYTYTYNGSLMTEAISEEKVAPSTVFVNDSRSVYSDHQTFTVTGLNDPVLAANTKVYPNPTSRELHIDLGPANAHIKQVALYSLTGQKVLEQAGHSQVSASLSVDVETLPKGIYLLRLTTADNRTVSRKVVRQ